MGAGHFRQFEFMEVTEGKPYNRASPRGNAPLLVPAAPLLLKGSMSLDFRGAALPYKSSSFATPEGKVLVAICNEQLKLAQGESIEQIST